MEKTVAPIGRPPQAHPSSALRRRPIREVVRLHGGTIRVTRCEPAGRGSVKVFEIRLPVLRGKD